MTKPPLTHQNLAGSTSPARVQLLSLQSTSAPSSWLRATRCPDMFLLQQFVSCGFLQWLLYCSISAGLPGSPQETRRCRISGGVVHQAVQSCPQRSFAADSSSLRAAVVCKPALKHRLGHLANVIANGWRDVQVLISSSMTRNGVGGRLEASQTSREALIFTHRVLLVSRAQIVSSVNTHWKLHCVSAGRFSENIAGLAGSLVPTGSESNSRRGSWEAWV